MEVVLEKSACRAVDAGISRRFEKITVIPRPAGIYMQANNAGRTVAVEHYIDRVLMRSYSGSSKAFSVPRVKFSLASAERVKAKVAGAVLKMVWTGSGISLKKKVYLLEAEETHPICTVAAFCFTIPCDALYSILQEAGEDLEIIIGGGRGCVRRAQARGVSLSVSIRIKEDTPCTAIIDKKHLKYIPHSTVYSTASIGVHEKGIVVMSFAAAGVTTSLYIAAEVLFFNGGSRDICNRVCEQESGGDSGDRERNSAE